MDTDGDGNRPRLSCYWSSEVTENLVSSLTISDHEPITRALSFPVKDSLYVASGIKYPNNGDRPGDWVIHDQIRKHRPELDRQRRQVLAQMAGRRVRSQQAEGGGHFLQHIAGKAIAPRLTR